MNTVIRVATAGDAQAIADIYGPIVEGTASSFEFEPPASAEFSHRIAKTLQVYPWLVLEKGGVVAGYAYADQYRYREGWKWSVSSSVYINSHYQRQGVGRVLYQRLFDILRLQGYYNVFAGATLPNPGSVALHEKVGFTSVGSYKSAGFKLGAWHDVIRWQLVLQPYPSAPSDPVPFARLPQAQVAAILGKVV